MLQRLLLITITLCSLSASAQWQQTGSKVRYVNGLGIPTKDTAAGVSADSSQILIRPADSSLYVKYKRTWLRVGGGAGGGSIGGSGTTNYLPKFTASGFIGNSQIFDDGTNVGIGTASPLEKLHVIGRVQASVATSGSSYFFASNTSGGTSYGNDGTGGYIFTNWNAPLLIYTNSLERMRITSVGNVGIGTASPSEKLHLAGNTFRQNDASNSYGYTISTTSATTTLATLFGGSSFGIRTGGSGSDYLRISSGGNVLIGTTTDNGVDQLQVSGSGLVTGNFVAASTSGNVSLRNTATTYAVNITTGATSGIGMYQDAGTAVIIGTNAAVTAMSPISIRGTTVDLDNNLKVNAAGRVLIGNPTPNDITGEAVQVNGAIICDQFKIWGLNTAPATASSTGTLGEIRIDANYIYICTATNTWKRVAIATW